MQHLSGNPSVKSKKPSIPFLINTQALNTKQLLTPASPSVNPIQRLSNLSSLMVHVIWQDYTLDSLLSQWNDLKFFSFKTHNEKLLGTTRLSPSVVVCALKYLERIKSQLSLVDQDTQLQDQLITWAACLLLAHKYLDDKHFSNKTFALVNHITTETLNNAEMKCLSLLNFSLAILEDEFNHWRKTIQSDVTKAISAINSRKIKRPVSRFSPYTAQLSPSIINTLSNQPTWGPLTPVSGQVRFNSLKINEVGVGRGSSVGFFLDSLNNDQKKRSV